MILTQGATGDDYLKLLEREQGYLQKIKILEEEREGCLQRLGQSEQLAKALGTEKQKAIQELCIEKDKHASAVRQNQMLRDDVARVEKKLEGTKKELDDLGEKCKRLQQREFEATDNSFKQETELKKAKEGVGAVELENAALKKTIQELEAAQGARQVNRMNAPQGASVQPGPAQTNVGAANIGILTGKPRFADDLLDAWRPRFTDNPLSTGRPRFADDLASTGRPRFADDVEPQRTSGGHQTASNAQSVMNLGTQGSANNQANSRTTFADNHSATPRAANVAPPFQNANRNNPAQNPWPQAPANPGQNVGYGGASIHQPVQQSQSAPQVSPSTATPNIDGYEHGRPRHNFRIPTRTPRGSSADHRNGKRKTSAGTGQGHQAHKHRRASSPEFEPAVEEEKIRREDDEYKRELHSMEDIGAVASSAAYTELLVNNSRVGKRVVRVSYRGVDKPQAKEHIYKTLAGRIKAISVTGGSELEIEWLHPVEAWDYYRFFTRKEYSSRSRQYNIIVTWPGDAIRRLPERVAKLVTADVPVYLDIETEHYYNNMNQKSLGDWVSNVLNGADIRRSCTHRTRDSMCEIYLLDIDHADIVHRKIMSDGHNNNYMKDEFAARRDPRKYLYGED